MSPLKDKRIARRMSQVDLAVKAGIQPGLLCRYERGVRPGKTNAVRIARALNCKVDSVFPNFENLRDY